MTEAEVPSCTVGLYSFPKSGNTWLRNVIAGMLDIPSSPGSLQKYITDTSYTHPVENPWRFQGTDWYFYKSHYKEIRQEHEGRPLVTDKVVYIYRHPLDVFVSYLNFISNNVAPRAGLPLGITFDRVEDLNPGQMEQLFTIFLECGTLIPQNQRFGSIFESIYNFKKIREISGTVHVLRYEDLFDNFAEETLKIADFVGLKDIDPKVVFERADRGTTLNGKFFWKRKKDNFRNYLTGEQINRFWQIYGEVLTDLGYHP